MSAQEPTSRAFRANVRAALADAQLQKALANTKTGFTERRLNATARLPEFGALCDAARDIKDHALANLDHYLERFEAKVIEAGGEVHWCATAADARASVLEICRGAGARMVTKGKTMIGEEIAINDHLAAHGIEAVETDLGEYIIQLRQEMPSHIIAPAIHVNQEQVAEAFVAAHPQFPAERDLSEPRALLDEARSVLRKRYIEADVGITGANFLIAETGSTVIVTNEGNGDLTQSLPKTHIVLASLEKIVPTLEDAMTLMRVLARSATGQENSVYTTFSTGARRADDPDGPRRFHVVLLDNGRTKLLGTEFQDMLRCIRCGACLNHCPVYGAVGGHAYGWVYPGPMGAVLSPGLIGIEEAHQLPSASTLCGRCEQVCPVRIPLPRMLRAWREAAFERQHVGTVERGGLNLWASLARRPALYRWVTGMAARLLARLGGNRGGFARLPLAGGWTDHRDLPAPEAASYRAEWWRQRARRAAGARP